VTITLYGKPGCHLCEVAHEVIRAARSDHGFELVEVDIESDPALFAKFQYDIPVVEIDGRRAFKYHVDPAALDRRLRRGEAT
jgi:glutaredoxin